MCSDSAIQVANLSKCYQIYGQPRDRLKQSIYPRVQRLFGRQPRRYFREFWGLKDVSFEVAKGETVGIVGRNGSGKSTLLQLICGTLNPTEGDIRTNGRIAALLELGAGFNPEFTGRENVYLNAAVLGLDRDETDARFGQIEAFADIGDFIDQPVKTYSSGMVVRLAFAVAINVDPQILVVDEALSVGDELFQRKCFSRIEEIRKSGATILFVSHSGGTVVELCDRAMLLDGGEKLAIGEPGQIVGRYQKLLYAPPEQKTAMREAIRAEGMESSVLPAPGDLAAQPAEASTLATTVQRMEGNFDSGLIPQSTLEYEPRGAHIQSPVVLTLEGRRVNNLVRGNVYRYCYRVRFTESATNVRFGMMIKTMTGVEVGGAASAPNPGGGLAHVDAGTTWSIEFSFRCSLNPGVYFLNAGALGELDGAEAFLHRVIDVAMFRVLPESNLLATGIVDFGCEPHVGIQSDVDQDLIACKTSLHETN